MLRDHHARPLRRLGIDRNNCKVLKLLPLVHVAWANGTIEGVKKARIAQLAHDRFAIGARGEAVLEGWLQTRPTKAYFRDGFQELLRLARAADEWEFELDELQALVAQAEAIARTTDAAMDQPTAVTSAEEAALADIARELSVDDGETWARLVGELGETRPPNAASR
jgi:hypothetical protein